LPVRSSTFFSRSPRVLLIKCEHGLVKLAELTG
jgi:hypothetical protein